MRQRVAVIGFSLFAAGALGQPGPQPFALPEIKVRYTCEKTGRYWVSYGKNPKDRHYCWDGTHYSRAEGGVPAFVLDFWAQKERERAQIRREIDERGAELRSQVAANQARLDGERRAMGLPTHEEIRKNPELARTMRMRPGQTGPSPAVEASSKPKAEPVDRALFDGLTIGVERSTVVEKLGEPHGQIGNLGSDGDEESLTYLIAGGGQANVRLKGGKVVAVRLPAKGPA